MLDWVEHEKRFITSGSGDHNASHDLQTQQENKQDKPRKRGPAASSQKTPLRTNNSGTTEGNVRHQFHKYIVYPYV